VGGSAVDRAEGQAAHQVALDQHAEDDRGHERGDRERARLAMLRGLEAHEGAEDGRQGEGVSAGQLEGEEEFGPDGDGAG
jgi:hypothetical protein